MIRASATSGRCLGHTNESAILKCKVCLVAELLGSSPALNQVNDEDDDSNYQQKVDQAAANVAEQAKKPEH